MSKFHELLTDTPVLLEGAMGTMLMQAGLPAGEPGEALTLERPAALADVHRQYTAAGARILITNTFNANRIRLAETSLADRLEVCNREAVRVAREVAGETCVVAGSIGPTGQMFAPLGPLSKEQAIEIFAEQAGFLANAGADVLLIETMMDVQEALAAVEACISVSDKPVIASMSFTEGPKGFHTMMGNALTDALPTLVDAGAFAVGANCQLAGEAMIRLAAVAKQAVDVPILIEPNAGQPQTEDGQTVYAETPESFAEHVARLAELGVQLIGGCCGTTPTHIAAAHKRINQ